MAGAAWALAGASALAGPPPSAYSLNTTAIGASYGYRSNLPVQYRYEDSYYGPRSAYPGPGEAYSWATGYGYRGFEQSAYAAAARAHANGPQAGPPSQFQGYDQAPYAAAGQAPYMNGPPGPPPQFQGYDQAVYAATGQARVANGPSAGPPPPFGGYDQAVYAAQGQPPELAGGPVVEPGASCPGVQQHERAIHCEYRPYGAAPPQNDYGR
jgi:hypothetical protein